MMEKYCTFAGWFLFVTGILAVGVERGYGDDLYKASLTGASLSSHEREVEGKISIKDNGKVELSINGLRTYPDRKLVNQNSELVIETEVNDSSKTYSETFLITDGDAELKFTLKDLNKDDKLEILSVAVNKGTSTTPTPTVTISPTPTGTATATPTVTASPTPAGSSTAAFMVSATTTTSDTILVPGGLISTSITPSPTPVATVSPTETPSIINATVEIKETINLKSRGKFKAFITLPSTYSVKDIDVDTVECEGAQAIDGKVNKNRFIATFRVQDLDLGFDIKFFKGRKDKKVEVTLDVSGELEDGTKFEGSDTVKIKGKKHDDDDDDNGKKRRD